MQFNMDLDFSVPPGASSSLRRYASTYCMQCCVGESRDWPGAWVRVLAVLCTGPKSWVTHEWALSRISFPICEMG